MEICKAHHVPVIEDAAESLGTVYHGQKTGTFGDYGCFSFNGNKIITTSGGGMLVCNLPEEEAMICVDGRRTWRVLENIYNNAAKYAMEGSRIYADLTVLEDQVLFTLKNVSAYPLNISADELTERFIRGDISRSTEGSGLGLSIAKTLTEMQKGQFELYLDGDLFKVTIRFPRVK